MTATTTSGLLGERLLTAAEAADLLGVPESWVREAARARRIPYLKLGKHVRFARSDLDSWLNERRVPDARGRRQEAPGRQPGRDPGDGTRRPSGARSTEGRRRDS